MTPHVLIVDDEPSIVTPLRFLMQQQGYSVQVLTDGADVLPAVRDVCPDLILLDVMLPSRNGYDLCRDLRADAPCPDVKIIMLTVKSREADEERARAAGADDYITKPFAIQHVIDAVKTLLDPHAQGE